MMGAEFFRPKPMCVHFPFRVLKGARRQTNWRDEMVASEDVIMRKGEISFIIYFFFFRFALFVYTLPGLWTKSQDAKGNVLLFSS